MATFSEILSQMSAEAKGTNAGATGVVSSSGGHSVDTGTRIRDLETALARVSLACEAMWRLMAEHNGFTDAQLQELIGALDEADGTKDGRFMPAPVDCVCGAKVRADAENCQFCSEPVDRRKMF